MYCTKHSDVPLDTAGQCWKCQQQPEAGEFKLPCPDPEGCEVFKEKIRLADHIDRLTAELAEAKQRVWFCGWCGCGRAYNPADKGYAKTALAEMQEHDQQCPKNPLVQQLAEANKEIERLKGFAELVSQGRMCGQNDCPANAYRMAKALLAGKPLGECSGHVEARIKELEGSA